MGQPDIHNIQSLHQNTEIIGSKTKGVFSSGGTEVQLNLDNSISLLNYPFFINCGPPEVQNSNSSQDTVTVCPFRCNFPHLEQMCLTSTFISTNRRPMFQCNH
eukprot:TRINITY_DN21813_c2_g1_i1.p1 TRINITY_DN21813_c2_g1~~TRINITY_DN21813_c2_g1_i1.p1  ORF type:complete len:103 (-),score=8.10 TRINITY_DN21813_c2_g1_i1:81-389(-)